MEENKLPSSDDLFTETQVDISSLIDIVPMGSPDIILTIFAQRVDNLNYISSALRSFPDIVSYIDRNPYLEAKQKVIDIPRFLSVLHSDLLNKV